MIVDDHEVVRQGVRRILESHNGWKIVGESANGEQALRLHAQLKPDVILMDITMPIMSGLEATTEIIKANPDSKVLIFTMHESPLLMQQVLSVGAKGALTKSKAASELQPRLAAILAGKTYFD